MVAEHIYLESLLYTVVGLKHVPNYYTDLPQTIQQSAAQQKMNELLTSFDRFKEDVPLNLDDFPLYEYSSPVGRACFFGSDPYDVCSTSSGKF